MLPVARRSRPATDILSIESIDNDLLSRVAGATLRYGLVLVVAWIGAMKFTGYEAEGIRPLIEASPLLSWSYRLGGVHSVSAALGVVEIAIAAMIAARNRYPRLAAAGGFLAAIMFLTTLTFLVSTPGWEGSLGGFPAISAMPGQFLLKDVVLLGAALWSSVDAIEAARATPAPPP